jgi:thioredoxin reductase (NADPH)
MVKAKKARVLVLGSGPAGNCAAIYTKRAGLDTILIAGPRRGGQLTVTSDVENYPGFAEPIKGGELMDNMIKQTKKVGVEIIEDVITKVNFGKKIKCVGESGDVYEAEALIISTGAEARWLGVKGEEEFMGYGVSGCAICDGPFFKNSEVAVIGGGDTAAEEAIYLASMAKKVYLIHRRDELRAEKIMQDKLFKNKKIKVIWDSILEEIQGKDKPKMVTNLVIKNKKTKKIKELKVDGVFIAIGYSPSTEIFKDTKLKLNKQGYIVTDTDSSKTNISGVYAAGDVSDKKFKQAVVAAGYGCVAALEVQKYLEDK